ncbi:MAG TPA: preprotein translocase subunit SecG [Sphingomonas sp.]|jgi:preprotein translocase subunit SecG
MFAFLLVVHAIIAAALVTVILMQRSEGGGLGMGGSPSGLMSARGAADFLTRATAVLASAFVLMSITLAVLAATRRTETIDTSLARQRPATQIPQQNPPADAAPFGGAAAAAATNAAAAAQPPANSTDVPLQR